MWAGIKAVKPGKRLNEVGRSIEGFARLSSYGTGRTSPQAAVAQRVRARRRKK